MDFSQAMTLQWSSGPERDDEGETTEEANNNIIGVSWLLRLLLEMFAFCIWFIRWVESYSSRKLLGLPFLFVSVQLSGENATDMMAMYLMLIGFCVALQYLTTDYRCWGRHPLLSSKKGILRLVVNVNLAIAFRCLQPTVPSIIDFTSPIKNTKLLPNENVMAFGLGEVIVGSLKLGDSYSETCTEDDRKCKFIEADQPKFEKSKDIPTETLEELKLFDAHRPQQLSETFQSILDFNSEKLIPALNDEL